MQIMLNSAWESHVIPGKFGLLHNPWGLGESDTYPLSIGYDSRTDEVKFAWDLTNYPRDPSKVLAYPAVYWGVPDAAFPAAAPYPDFYDDLNGKTEYDVWIDDTITRDNGIAHNYAFESFRYSDAPKRGSGGTATHEIMLWTNRPTDGTIGLGTYRGSALLSGAEFGIYTKTNEPKYIAFILEGGETSPIQINWSEVLRKAEFLFDDLSGLEPFDPDDSFYAIEAGPELWGGYVRSITVSHTVSRAERFTIPIENPDQPDSCELMSLQATLLFMECARKRGDTFNAHRWHGRADNELAEYYNRYLR